MRVSSPVAMRNSCSNLQVGPGRRVLIEWYGYPRALDLALPDTINIAEDRFGRLACLLHASRKPSTLQTLNTTGFINNEIAGHFGLVFDIPTNVLITREPMSLYQLLHRRKDATREPLPSLDQRYRLAASLSTSLYTFMLSQWHHKRFLSQSIAFLYENKVPLPKLLDLEKPYIGGFSVSRPEDPQSESIESVLSIEERSYFHPLYRPWEPNRPKYRRAFDIYSFGLMLVEIGWWNLLKKIVPSSADGEDFRQLVIAKCQDDLACWMGERYLAVTLRCLNVDDTNMGGVGENLSDFLLASRS